MGLRGTFPAATNTPLGFRWEREGCGAGHAESPGWPGQGVEKMLFSYVSVNQKCNSDGIQV